MSGPRGARDLACRFHYGDVVVASEVPVGGQPAADGAAADWIVRIDALSESHDRPYQSWTDEDGLVVAAFQHVAGRHVIDFGAGQRFAVDPIARTITCNPVAAEDAIQAAQHLLYDVLPLAMSLTRLTLHASAVSAHGGAIVFAGPSGAGKSTIAVRLAQRGWSLVTDDIAMVETTAPAPAILPHRGGVRMWGDSCEALGAPHAAAGQSAKSTLDPQRLGLVPADAPVPIRAMFVLDRTACDELTPLCPHAAAAAVLSHAFVLASDDAAHAARLFGQVSTLVAAVPLMRLRPPVSFGELDHVIDRALSACSA